MPKLRYTPENSNGGSDKCDGILMDCIRLLWDRNMIESGQFFFGSHSTVAVAHSLNLARIVRRRKRCNNCEREGEGGAGGGTMSLKASDVAVINDS